jgi:hypothetical protein
MKMKNLEICIDENTTHFLNPFVAEFNVRGVVTFTTDLEPEDLNGSVDLMYDLMSGAQEVDEEGRPYKGGQVQLFVPGTDGPDWHDDTTRLAVGYSAEIEGETAVAFLVFSEEQMIETWKDMGATLKQKLHEIGELAEAGDAAAKDTWRLLNMVIDCLKFVSGEEADFANTIHAWAASKGRNAKVHFASALPMAA